MAELNWDDLRYFLAVARERRVSAAGRRGGLTPLKPIWEHDCLIAPWKVMP